MAPHPQVFHQHPAGLCSNRVEPYLWTWHLGQLDCTLARGIFREVSCTKSTSFSPCQASKPPESVFFTPTTSRFQKICQLGLQCPGNLELPLFREPQAANVASKETRRPPRLPAPNWSPASSKGSNVHTSRQVPVRRGSPSQF